MEYKAIVIGSSTGGFYALKHIITALPTGFALPIIIVQHISANSDNFMAKYLNSLTTIEVKEADEKEPILPGTVYIAPPNYHLLVEENYTLSLSTEQKRNYSRPSIDVLFETAALAFENQLIGVILTGANHDGALGLLAIKKAGGLCITQDPAQSEAYVMPQSAIEMADPQFILSLDNIAKKLIELDKESRATQPTE